MSGSGPGLPSLTIRPLASKAEYEACAALQEEVWGRGFSERVSPAILMVANRIGGLAAGAFDRDGGLHGFVFGLTGVIGGALVHWSDMLGVRSGLRDQGLGTRLKLYQREVLLERGVERMHWTFDPLQARNGYVNFCKLGARAGDYVPEMYGETDSPLHRGVGTDRLIVTWDMASERVEDLLGRNEGGPSGSRGSGGRGRSRVSGSGLPSVLETGMQDGFPVPLSYTLERDDARLLLPVPADIEGIMRANLGLAARWRSLTSAPFRHYLVAGYQVEGFVRGASMSAYVLARSESRPPQEKA